MSKKALCVGINDYPYDGSDLNCCVNDAKTWADLLVFTNSSHSAYVADANGDEERYDEAI